MQNDSSGGGNGALPLRLQDVDVTHEFPAHVLHVLNPGKPIPCTEIICRLLHVCMIETGFIPIIEEEPDSEVEALIDTTWKESVPILIRKLGRIIEKVGNLHCVNYTAVVLEHPYTNSVTLSEEDQSNLSNESDSSLAFSGIPVTSKESGDGSTVISMNIEEQEKGEIAKTAVTAGSTSEQQVEKVKKVFAEKISVSIIHEGLSIYVVANGPGFHKNAQISIPQYLRPKNTENFPMSAKIEDYYKLMNFSVTRFADDVKRGFCYQIMDEIDSLSFDIRSLSWFPNEIIVEIAKRCSPVAVFRLRATCSTIRGALSDNNQQFWKMMLNRDFPQYNMEQLKSDVSLDKFYRKYIEMWNFTLRRPLRRAIGQPRFFPFYLMSAFRL